MRPRAFAIFVFCHEPAPKIRIGSVVCIAGAFGAAGFRYHRATHRRHGDLGGCRDHLPRLRNVSSGKQGAPSSGELPDLSALRFATLSGVLVRGTPGPTCAARDRDRPGLHFNTGDSTQFHCGVRRATARTSRHPDLSFASLPRAVPHAPRHSCQDPTSCHVPLCRSRSPPGPDRRPHEPPRAISRAGRSSDAPSRSQASLAIKFPITSSRAPVPIGILPIPRLTTLCQTGGPSESRSDARHAIAWNVKSDLARPFSGRP